MNRLIGTLKNFTYSGILLFFSSSLPFVFWVFGVLDSKTTISFTLLILFLWVALSKLFWKKVFHSKPLRFSTTWQRSFQQLFESSFRDSSFELQVYSGLRMEAWVLQNSKTSFTLFMSDSLVSVISEEGILKLKESFQLFRNRVERSPLSRAILYSPFLCLLPEAFKDWLMRTRLGDHCIYLQKQVESHSYR